MSETSSVDLTNYETSDLLVFTEAAANKVKNLIEEENNDTESTMVTPAEEPIKLKTNDNLDIEKFLKII